MYSIYNIYNNHPLQSLDKLVTKSLERVRELLLALSLPLGTVLAGDSTTARKGNVHDVLAVVALVAVETLVGEAQLGQGDGSLAGRGAAVGVAPDAVVLKEEENRLAIFNTSRTTMMNIQACRRRQQP